VILLKAKKFSVEIPGLKLKDIYRLNLKMHGVAMTSNLQGDLAQADDGKRLLKRKIGDA